MSISNKRLLTFFILFFVVSILSEVWLNTECREDLVCNDKLNFENEKYMIKDIEFACIYSHLKGASEFEQKDLLIGYGINNEIKFVYPVDPEIPGGGSTHLYIILVENEKILYGSYQNSLFKTEYMITDNGIFSYHSDVKKPINFSNLESDFSYVEEKRTELETIQNYNIMACGYR